MRKACVLALTLCVGAPVRTWAEEPKSPQTLPAAEPSTRYVDVPEDMGRLVAPRPVCLLYAPSLEILQRSKNLDRVLQNVDRPEGVTPDVVDLTRPVLLAFHRQVPPAWTLVVALKEGVNLPGLRRGRYVALGPGTPDRVQDEAPVLARRVLSGHVALRLAIDEIPASIRRLAVPEIGALLGGVVRKGVADGIGEERLRSTGDVVDVVVQHLLSPLHKTLVHGETLDLAMTMQAGTGRTYVRGVVVGKEGSALDRRGADDARLEGLSRYVLPGAKTALIARLDLAGFWGDVKEPLLRATSRGENGAIREDTRDMVERLHRVLKAVGERHVMSRRVVDGEDQVLIAHPVSDADEALDAVRAAFRSLTDGPRLIEEEREQSGRWLLHHFHVGHEGGRKEAQERDGEPRFRITCALDGGHLTWFFGGSGDELVRVLKRRVPGKLRVPYLAAAQAKLGFWFRTDASAGDNGRDFRVDAGSRGRNHYFSMVFDTKGLFGGTSDGETEEEK